MESKCGFYFKRCNDSSVNRSSKCLNLLCIFEYWNSNTCNNSSKCRRAERYWGRWCRFFLSSNIPALWICHSAVFHRGCGKCHPSHVSFHASDLYQSRFTFKVEFLCTDIKLTWWMICQTKPELQSSIIQLQVMIPNVYTFTFNDTNVDVYHPATNNILRLFITVLYITDGQEKLPKDSWLNIPSVNYISRQLYHVLNTQIMEDWRRFSMCFSQLRDKGLSFSEQIDKNIWRIV